MKEVSIKNFENRMKTLEIRNLKKYGHSLTWTSLLNKFNTCIIEIREKTIIFDEQKYKEIKQNIEKEAIQ